MQLEKFLFCEMARNEANGQISLIGLHAGDLLKVEVPRGAQLLLPNLSCVVVLSDLSGVRSLRIQCHVRFGAQEVLNTPEQVHPRPDLPFYTLMFAFASFPFLQGPGDYEFRVTIQPDQQRPTTYSRRFRLETQEPPAQTTH